MPPSEAALPPPCRVRAWRPALWRPSRPPRSEAPPALAARRRALNSYGRELVDVYVVDASSGDIVKRACAGRCDRPAEVSTHGGVALLVDNNQLLRVLDPVSGAVPVVPDYKISHPTKY